MKVCIDGFRSLLLRTAKHEDVIALDIDEVVVSGLLEMAEDIIGQLVDQIESEEKK
jgi:hypothetical protein